MTGLTEELAALRSSLTELRVGVARRWAVRHGAALPGSVERSVRRLGLRVLDRAPRHEAAAGRRSPPPQAARVPQRRPLGGRSVARPGVTRPRRAAGAALLAVSLLGPLVSWLAARALSTGERGLLLGIGACGMALGLRLLLRR